MVDGSQVTLDVGSLIAVDYTSGERRVRMPQGQARFDIACAQGSGFAIDAEGGTIIADDGLVDVDLSGQTVKLVAGAAGSTFRGAAAELVSMMRDGRKQSPARRFTPDQPGATSVPA